MNDHHPCPRCGETIEAEFDACWNCGTHRDGGAPDPAFARDDDAPPVRALDCLRCRSPMAPLGRLRFHEGSRAMPFLLGNLGELFVNRQHFDAYACERCGKVEFFLAAPHAAGEHAP
jgi:ribosomal protein S27AE